jgi:GT2 family glycosyltransferase
MISGLTSQACDVSDVSIVMVNWNAGQMTASALASIYEQTRGVTFELIVVDNGSTRDDSATMLPGRFPSITFIANSWNMGFSAANNQGIASATGRYVLLLNNDTIQTEDAISAAVRYMDGHPDVGALGIEHRNADAERSLQGSTSTFPEPWRELRWLLTFPAATSDRRTTAAGDLERDVDWVTGSFLMIRRACLEDVGLLDERFFVYEEDIDWCRRAWNKGWKVRFWRGATMVHIGAATRPFIRDKTFAHVRTHVTYLRKHHGGAAAALFYGVMVARLSAATSWQLVKWMIGAAPLSHVRERWQRQIDFALLRSGRHGIERTDD